MKVVRTVTASAGGFQPLDGSWYTVVSIVNGTDNNRSGFQIACGGNEGTIMGIRGIDHGVWSNWITLT